MKSLRTAPFGERIDKLTNSIENGLTGESFPTQIRPLTTVQAKKLIAKDWVFNWSREAAMPDREVFQLNTVSNPGIIHGLISIEPLKDLVFMHLIESAAFNKTRNKAYLGVPANLVAYICLRSFQLGHDGYVTFDSKTALIQHYKDSLGAIQLNGMRMYIGTPAAAKLVKRYFPQYLIS